MINGRGLAHSETVALLAHQGVTSKELEVLDALAQRLSNAEIAARLCISERTVEGHVSSLLRKLEADNRRELARLAPSGTGSDVRDDQSVRRWRMLTLDVEGSAVIWEWDGELKARVLSLDDATTRYGFFGHRRDVVVGDADGFTVMFAPTRVGGDREPVDAKGSVE
jgi:DNA-binding CsgD family transcriptional regulator